MQPHERELFISLCLGVTLTGEESVTDLERLLEETSQNAKDQKPVSLQSEVSEWLRVSISDCESRRQASEVLWTEVIQKQYTLIDIPMSLRRTAFGDEQAHRRRAWNKGRPERVKAALQTLAIKLAVLAGVIGLGWYLVKRFVL